MRAPRCGCSIPQCTAYIRTCHRRVRVQSAVTPTRLKGVVAAEVTEDTGEIRGVKVRWVTVRVAGHTVEQVL